MTTKLSMDSKFNHIILEKINF